MGISLEIVCYILVLVWEVVVQFAHDLAKGMLVMERHCLIDEHQ